LLRCVALPSSRAEFLRRVRSGFVRWRCRADLSPFARVAVFKSELFRSKRLNDNAKKREQWKHDALNFANCSKPARNGKTPSAQPTAQKTKKARVGKDHAQRGGGAAYSHGRPSRGRDDHE